MRMGATKCDCGRSTPVRFPAAARGSRCPEANVAHERLNPTRIVYGGGMRGVFFALLVCSCGDDSITPAIDAAHGDARGDAPVVDAPALVDAPAIDAPEADATVDAAIACPYNGPPLIDPQSLPSC